MAFLRVHDPLRHNTQEIPLRKPLVSLGRSAGNDVVLEDVAVASTHANLMRRGTATASA